LQGLFTAHFEHYNVEDTAECYHKSDEKLQKVKSYQNAKHFCYTQSHNRVQQKQSLDTVRAQQMPVEMVTKRLFITH